MALLRKSLARWLSRLSRRLSDWSLRLYPRREQIADRFRNRPRPNPYLLAADIPTIDTPMIDDEDD